MTDHSLLCGDMRKTISLVEERTREAEWTFTVR